MESFDMFLNGNFVALPVFARKYGVHVKGADPDKFAIPTRWQSALFQSGQCGAFVGVFLAGPVTNRLGYRWTTILALILMNATIFISFFVSHSVLLLSPSPNLRHSGRLPDRTHRWTSTGRRSLGNFYSKLASLCLGDRPSRPSRCMYSYPSNELVDRWNHCRRCHLWLQQAERSVGLASTSCAAMDLPSACLLSILITAELTCIDSSLDPHLLRTRIPLVARSKRTQS